MAGRNVDLPAQRATCAFACAGLAQRSAFFLRAGSKAHHTGHAWFHDAGKPCCWAPPLAEALKRRNADHAEKWVVQVASGLIAAERVMGIVVPLLTVMGVLAK